jgi:chromosome segregation ATPase
MKTLNPFLFMRKRIAAEISRNLTQSLDAESKELRAELGTTVELLARELEGKLENVSDIFRQNEYLVGEIERMKHLIVSHGESLRALREEFEMAKRSQKAIEAEQASSDQELRLMRDHLNAIAIASTEQGRSLLSYLELLEKRLAKASFD